MNRIAQFLGAKKWPPCSLWRHVYLSWVLLQNPSSQRTFANLLDVSNFGCFMMFYVWILNIWVWMLCLIHIYIYIYTQYALIIFSLTCESWYLLFRALSKDQRWWLRPQIVQTSWIKPWCVRDALIVRSRCPWLMDSASMELTYPTWGKGNSP